MYNNPEMMLLLATDTLRGLRAEADRQRLLTVASRARRAGRRRAAGRHRSRAGASDPASTLAACAPTAAPAR